MIEPSSASSSLKAVSIRQATSGARDRTSRQTDTPVTIRQLDIEHRDAGTQRRNPGQRRGCGARLAGYLNVRLGLEKDAVDLRTISWSSRTKTPIGLLAGPAEVLLLTRT
jgi:hypothetical protein